MKSHKNHFAIRGLLLGFGLLIAHRITERAIAQDGAKSTPSETPLPKEKITPGKQNPPTAPVMDAETKAVLKVISEKYAKLHNWEAKFTHENFSIGLNHGSFNQGDFVFSYPNKFRFSLTGPEFADYICDGKKFWQIQFRDGKDKPANVKEFSDVAKVEVDKYLFFLRGIDALNEKKQKKLLKDFAITGKSVDDELHLVLEPRKTTEIVRMTLIFKQNSGIPYRAIIEDTLGNPTKITLTSHKILKTVDSKNFIPQYPKDSKIEKF